MEGLRLARYALILVGILCFIGAISFNIRFNSDDAVDVAADGIVVTKYARKERRASSDKRNRYRKVYYIGVIYPLKSDLSPSHKTSQDLQKQQERNLSHAKIDRDKLIESASPFMTSNNLSLENILYGNIRTNRRKKYERYNTNDKVEVFYRSDRPGFPSFNLNTARNNIPLLIGFGVIFILLGLIGILSAKHHQKGWNEY